MTNKSGFSAVLVCAALGFPAAGLSGQTTADEAWHRGDMAQAEQLYSQRLAADSVDHVALHRMGLLLAWGEHYDRSLELFDRLLTAAPDSLDARIDRARVLAWRGDSRAAAQALAPVLAAHPAYLPALRARAQFASWAGDYDVAISTYGEVITLSPDDRAARLERARVLSWAAHYVQAASAFDSLLRADETNREARLGLARTLAWSNQRDSAEAVYRGMLAVDASDPDALRGLAQSASWSGDLRGGERRWREILARNADDAAAWIGLSQTLRWQGRYGPALTAALRAAELAPTDADARTQVKWARAALAPRLAPTTSYESDSDGNRIVTTALAAAWSPLHWLQFRADGYIRRADQRTGVTMQREATGLQISASGMLRGGWLLGTAIGASGREGAANRHGLVRASVASPAHLPLAAAVTYSNSPLDATALMIERGLRVEEWAMSWRAAPDRRWTFASRISQTAFDGLEHNRRRLGGAELTRRVSRSWTLGSAVNAFGFSHDRNDGYFDPDFYGIAELNGRWTTEGTRWRVTAELAPGVQRVGSRGPVTGAGRAGGGITYLIAPGRELGISGGYSSSGIDALTTTDADYRYRSLRVTGAWSW